ncbi:MAG: tRNA uridine-5-carboxymethylaminomethyl(34) synthesis GTPase MnmE [Deltaproteobacteria bacterium]|jgi:tRNA modification GTPase|nr:tRNA uridine-5-carboxymethylaminomethyl(34) synthesis GTPase MnmE [Deltaproteobacteria bacterium]
MSASNYTDTIAAIGTARGLGGIGIVRLSGPDSLSLLQRLFSRQSRLSQKAPAILPPTVDILPQASADSSPLPQNIPTPFNFSPRKLEHGWLLDTAGRPLDEVMAVFMPGPHSFSGEDMAEIHCHGGRAVLDAVLEACLMAGARLAEAGEFTRRAFLNDRMDLSQAEAVAEMIAAPTLQGVFLARNKLEGRLGLDLEAARQSLDWLRARLYLAIDFPDDAEDDPAPDAEFNSRLANLQGQFAALLQSFERARIWREGALAVIAGRVNAGKSSLLNALLGRKRALVSATPGTTRDYIEESLNLDGLPLRLIDTAGLRPAEQIEVDEVEAEGIELAKDFFARAEAILLVLDASTEPFASPPRLEDEEILRLYGPASGHSKVIVVLNKLDLLPEFAAPDELYGCPCCAISARDGQGLDRLTARLREFILPLGDGLDFSSQAAPNLRQAVKIRAVLRDLEELSREYDGRIPAELLSVRLDSAAAHLADIMGSGDTEAVLDQVFSAFCIGK